MFHSGCEYVDNYQHVWGFDRWHLTAGRFYKEGVHVPVVNLGRHLTTDRTQWPAVGNRAVGKESLDGRRS